MRHENMTECELDAAVAREVMGWEVVVDKSGTPWVWAGKAKRHSYRTHTIDYNWCRATPPTATPPCSCWRRSRRRD